MFAVRAEVRCAAAGYQSQRERRDAFLVARLKVLGEQYPRYGYVLLHEIMRTEGLVKIKKRTYRLYTALKMQVRTKRRQKLVRPRVPMAVPSRPNELWSLDLIHDQLTHDRRFKVLNIVDDYSRVCVGQLVDTSISGARMARFLDQLAGLRGLPDTDLMDNGPEMTSKAMFFWGRDRRVSLAFIQLGKPSQNAFVESFNGRFRYTCLNLHWFESLADARTLIDACRRHYNEERPHSALGYKPPSVFERLAA